MECRGEGWESFLWLLDNLLFPHARAPGKGQEGAFLKTQGGSTEGALRDLTAVHHHFVAEGTVT